MPRPRGARPSPRHRLASAVPHRIVGATPAQWLWKPVQISMWLNATYGDCVTAEEAFAKACNVPEIFIPDATVLAWATTNGALNGADLTTVLDIMQSAGFPQDGNLYNDGPFNSVDWTNTAALQNAIATGPVKIGVAADQLENAVPNPPVNGWVATGFQPDSNEDHCTSLCGFGSIAWLVSQLGGSVPSGVDGTQPGYGLFTWDSIGVIDVPSLLAICAEAWLRLPTTVVAPARKKPPYQR
jgi:hypothetical protein